MKAVLVAATLTLIAGGNVSLAQTAAPPPPASTTAPPAEVATPPSAVEPTTRRDEVVSERSLNDPNTTGPDKVNGLPVPQMKGETADPR